VITSAVHVRSVGDAATCTRDSVGQGRLGALASIRPGLGRPTGQVN